MLACVCFPYFFLFFLIVERENREDKFTPYPPDKRQQVPKIQIIKTKRHKKSIFIQHVLRYIVRAFKQ